MSHKEILEKAIQKAIDGGWRPGWQDRRPVTKWSADYSDDFEGGEGILVIGNHAKSSASYWTFPMKSLIFDHEFSKALWKGASTPEPDEPDDNHATLGLYSARGGGYEGYGDYTCLDFNGAPWQYHLQQMVISDDPIKYLEEHM